MGLITIDFRRLKAPNFFAVWPGKNEWEKPSSYREFIDRDYIDKGFYKGIRGYYEFRWKAADTKGELNVVTQICKDYKLAQALFLLKSTGMTNALPIPWNRCDKQFGTFCVSDVDKEYLFFLYKNVVLSIITATNKQISEQTAQWLSDVLKGFPLIPINAPFQFRSEPYSTPVFEYFGSEAPAADASSE
jgi:hypothetical protein